MHYVTDDGVNYMVKYLYYLADWSTTKRPSSARIPHCNGLRSQALGRYMSGQTHSVLFANNSVTLKLTQLSNILIT